MINAKNTLFLAATVITVLNFQSCSKYEEGPKFSLRTKKARLTGDWEVVRVGNQTPPAGYSIEMEFDKDGDLTFSYAYGGYAYSYGGEWEFSSDKEELEVQLDGETQINTWEILRLKNDELWFEDEDNTEWRLEAK
ncbi:MAG: lipocalin-like domain-containing protein [Bacteroidota bacterium]